jgi:hypothetical protein
MTAKKYEILQDQTLEHEGRTLYRIRRLGDGKVGGWIEKEENLSQEGRGFVHNEAKVYGDAKVSESADVYDYAEMYGNAKAFGNATVYDDAQVGGNAEVFGFAKVLGFAKVYGNAKVYGDALVFVNAQVYGNAKLFGNARVCGWAEVWGEATVTVDAILKGMSRDDITVTDKHIIVGCQNHTFEHWEQHIEEIGKEHDYTDAEIAEYKEAIFALIAQRRAQGF